MTVQDIRACLHSAVTQLNACYARISRTVTPGLDDAFQRAGLVEEKLLEAYGSSIVHAESEYPQITDQIRQARDVLEGIQGFMGSVYEPLENAYSWILRAVGDKFIEAQMFISVANEKLQEMDGKLIISTNQISSCMTVAHIHSREYALECQATLRGCEMVARDAQAAIMSAIDLVKAYERTL